MILKEPLQPVMIKEVVELQQASPQLFPVQVLRQAHFRVLFLILEQVQLPPRLLLVYLQGQDPANQHHFHSLLHNHRCLSLRAKQQR